MTKRPEFVQIEAGEDVASVKDRLSFIRGQNVLLIWPEEGTALTRKLDLVLIQREAMRRAIRLALVTHDPLVMRHADELNISTFETIGSSERARWKRGRSKVFMARFQRPKDTPDPEDLMDVASRVRADTPQPSRLRQALVRIGVLMLLVGLVLGVAYVIVPSATVTLVPAEQVVEASVQIIADPNFSGRTVDVENGVIPTLILRVDVQSTASLATTGTQEQTGVPAIGSVIFINRTAADVTVPMGTTVSTGTGDPVMFRTTREVLVPAGDGGEVEVNIEAMPAFSGEIGNVDVNLINTVIGPLENSLIVANRTPTFGGESRGLRVVTQDDRDRLLGQMRQQLQALAFVEMEGQLGPNQFILESTIRIIEERADSTIFSAQVDDLAETLTLTMRATVEAVAVNEQLGQQVVFTRMAGQIPRGRIIRPETVVYDRGPVAIDPQTGLITFTMSGSGMVVGQVNTALLQDRLAGKSVEEALAYIMREVDLSDNQPPQITVTPDWFGQMPILPMRITVMVQDPS